MSAAAVRQRDRMLLEDCLIKSHESIEVLTEQVLSKTHGFLDQSLKEYESN